MRKSLKNYFEGNKTSNKDNLFQKVAQEIAVVNYQVFESVEDSNHHL